jgi:hypothetical protein
MLAPRLRRPSCPDAAQDDHRRNRLRPIQVRRTLLITHTLGGSGPRVSAIGPGCMELSHGYGPAVDTGTAMPSSAPPSTAASPSPTPLRCTARSPTRNSSEIRRTGLESRRSHNKTRLQGSAKQQPHRKSLANCRTNRGRSGRHGRAGGQRVADGFAAGGVEEVQPGGVDGELEWLPGPGGGPG